MSDTPTNQTTEQRCGDCKHFWPLVGQCIIPHWNEHDLAGTCPHSQFRLRTDEPFLDCFEALS